MVDGFLYYCPFFAISAYSLSLHIHTLISFEPNTVLGKFTRSSVWKYIYLDDGTSETGSIMITYWFSRFWISNRIRHFTNSIQNTKIKNPIFSVRLLSSMESPKISRKRNVIFALKLDYLVWCWANTDLMWFTVSVCESHFNFMAKRHRWKIILFMYAFTMAP